MSKNSVLLSLLVVVLPGLVLGGPAARADVCQRGNGKIQLHVRERRDHTIEFYFGEGRHARPVGPATTFTREELDGKRKEADELISKIHRAQTNNKLADGYNLGLLLILGAALAGDPNARVDAANHDGPGFANHEPVDTSQLPHATALSDALEAYRVYPNKDCVAWVDSVDAYKTELADALTEIYNERLAKAGTLAANAGVEGEASAAKTIGRAAQTTAERSPVGATGPGQSAAQ